MVPALWKIKPALDTPTGGICLGPSGTINTDGVWLGSLGEIVSGKIPKVWLSTVKEQVIAVVGKRGSGKSFTLGAIAEGFALSTPKLEVARQNKQRATLLFDPLDIYWTTKFGVSPNRNAEANKHYQLANSIGLTGIEFNVDAWIPGAANVRSSDPHWFNLLQLPVSALGFEEWEMLLETNILSEPIGQALIDAISLTSATGYRRGGATIPPVNLYDLTNLVDAVQSDELTTVYHSETLRALRQRLNSLNSTGLFSATGTTISQLLSSGRLTVILLGRLPQSYRTAVVTLLTKMLIENRSSVSFAEKRLVLDPNLTDDVRLNLENIVAQGVPKTFVVLDEAQAFLAPDVYGTARRTFVKLVKEGRNIGLSAIISTQQPSAIDQRILSQVETFIAHQLVTEPDIRSVRENIKSSLPESIEFGKQNFDFAGLLRRLPPGQCLISTADMNTNIRRCLMVSIRPRATVHGGIEL